MPDPLEILSGILPQVQCAGKKKLIYICISLFLFFCKGRIVHFLALALTYLSKILEQIISQFNDQFMGINIFTCLT